MHAPDQMFCPDVILLFYYFVFVIIIIIIIIIIMILIRFHFAYVCVLVYVVCPLFLSYGNPLRLLTTFWNYQIYTWDCLVPVFYPFSGKTWGLGFGLRFLT